jgi:hypothetical protein
MIYERCGEPERKLMRSLLNFGEPREALLLAEIIAYFPGTTVDRRDESRWHREVESSAA